ncbi:MAG TPA: AtpZ/AtpI family protein [Desulfitobacteriaceae bacterium]|nr:AtpZ/AtpI family protein [Desulfitobacteriaceae bacterium]
MKDSRKFLLKAAAVGTSISSTLAGLVLGGFFFGQYLDNRWGTRPLMQLSLMLIGLVLGGIFFVMALIKLGNTDDET